jgi:hypothetical protein
MHRFFSNSPARDESMAGRSMWKAERAPPLANSGPRGGDADAGAARAATRKRGGRFSRPRRL